MLKTALFTPDMDLRKVAMSLETADRMNFGHESFPASYIARELTNEHGVAVVLFEEDIAVGYTAATDARQVYYTNSYYYGRDPIGAAYVTNSSIHPDFQHRGHIWTMMEMAEEVLRGREFKFLDRDTRSDLGYADKVIARYGEKVVFAEPAVRTEYGHQRYIRVKL